MHYISPLVFFLLHLCTVATAAPIPEEVVRFKSKVKWMAEQLVFKINNNFKQIPPCPNTSSPSVEQYGPASIIMILDGYNSLILDSFTNAPQIKFEMAALARFVDLSTRSSNCTDRPKPPVPKALAELQGQRQYPVSVTCTALFQAQKYLENLLKHLDQLDTCT